MNFPRLYVVIDRTSAAQHGCGDAVDAVLQAAMAGARMFQLRDKELSGLELYRFGQQIDAVLAGVHAELFVNERADLAMALDARGVHRPSHGLPIPALRWVLEYRPIGASCHSLEEALEAESDGADFITLSPIFATESKPDYGPPLGLEALREVCQALSIPVYALGGVKPANAADCVQHGAHGVAVMGGIMAASDPFRATSQYLAALGPN